jgi:hypothetical protein
MQKTVDIHRQSFLVEEGGFEPPKALPTDLQSAPFGRSGIPPHMVPGVGIEPTTRGFSVLCSTD